jgi:hypothetical protein
MSMIPEFDVLLSQLSRFAIIDSRRLPTEALFHVLEGTNCTVTNASELQ